MSDIRHKYVRLVHDTIDYLTTGFSSRTGGHAGGGKTPEKITLLEDLSQEIRSCTKCGLHQGRTYAVPGEGNSDAGILFIGEGPGQREDIEGRPFVGRAGQLLTSMLAAIDLTREEVYITNIVKCRPPQNRTPLPEEIAQCLPFLERQITLIDPLVICCLGGSAAAAVLGSAAGVSKLRGTMYRYHAFPGPNTDSGVPVIVTYHPAAVLRFPDKYRRPVWNDLKLLRDYYRDIRL
jgi:uracil-DNA glycosylase family 4